MDGPTMRGRKVEELPDAGPNDPLALEWNTYKREAPRLIAEGHEGRYVLIKDGYIYGIWDTQSEAIREGYRKFGNVPFMAHRISAIEPRYRMPWC
jgi:hypothetical protein